MSNRLCILGGGSWGTALALALARRFTEVSLWCHDPARAAEIAQHRSNRRYLPGFLLPENVRVVADLSQAAAGSALIVIAVPSYAVRKTMSRLREPAHAAKFVSATKGLEQATLKRMSEVIAEALELERGEHVAVLSGPTFAKEIAAGEPAAVAIACSDKATASDIQRQLSTEMLRLYTTTDVIGVEIGAAMKNVIAIGAGLCSGLGLGSNSVAALVSRGLAEISRLATAMGGQERTLAGLAGLGDLVLTATGDLSRNRRVGLELGRGRQLDDILASMGMVAEGVATCQAARSLGKRYGTSLPIIEQMYKVLYEAQDPRAAIRELMERPLTAE